MKWLSLMLSVSLLTLIRTEKDNDDDRQLVENPKGQELLKHVHFPEDYDKHEFPYFECEVPNTKQNATEVQIRFKPEGIGDISLKLMIFEVQLSIVFSWNDCRIQISEDYFKLIYSKEFIQKLWIPKMKIINCLRCKEIEYDFDTDNFAIFDNHFYVQALRTEKVNCKYDLRAYPLEVQRCSVKIILEDEAMFVEFNQHSSKMQNLSSDMSPQEFTVEKIIISRCENVKISYNSAFAEYSCVVLDFYLKRAMRFHLIVTYIPSIFLVMLSWISFWLDPMTAAPRVALGVTTMLALTTQFISTQGDLPSVPYVKALDVWMFGCIFLVFLSLVEFAFSNVMNRQHNNRSVFPKIRVKQRHQITSWNSSLIKNGKTYSKPYISLPDRISRFLFPLAFIIFNICYWNYYLKNNTPKIKK